VYISEQYRVLKVFEPFILGFCHCDCGTEMPIISKKHGYRKKCYLRRYLEGHQSKKPPEQRIIRCHEYTMLYRPDHPFCNKQGYIMRHRIVYEEYHNVCLLPWTDIHHIIPVDKGGSDGIENLMPITRSDHMKLHKTIHKDTICLIDSSHITSITKRGLPRWHRYLDGYVCNKCGMKMYYQKNKEKINSKRRKKKSILLYT